LELQERQEELAGLISQELGSPIKFSMMVQTGLPIMDFASMEHLVGELPWEQRIGNSLVVREPIGVVGAITPWNYPLHQVVAKVAAALAAGCTVVLKPSEVAPLSAFALAEVFEQVGLPAGVFNLVTGLGPVVGEAIAEHPDVDMVSFTGSTAAGKRVMAVAAGTVKKVALELGGKSAFVVLDDADLGKAVKIGLANCFINAGQTCTAWTQMLVPAARYDEAISLIEDAAAKYPVGAPTDDGTRIGPLANANQYKKVVGFIEQAVADGATVVVGGPERPEGLDKGYYVRPTVLGGVVPGSRVEQEEVFGPVLAVIPYDSEDDAVAIANGTPYGLSGGVFSGDQDRAVAVARRMRTGMVDVNGGRFNPLAPFGGYKQSGNGRELGEYGLEEFLEVKSLQL
ncbi:MAG: Aldehyde Dehydrogenase, partial [Frankiales bacterium]|nr:Aldehyde Dehydrogenase [Frankiales bacterium]